MESACHQFAALGGVAMRFHSHDLCQDRQKFSMADPLILGDVKRAPLPLPRFYQLLDNIYHIERIHVVQRIIGRFRHKNHATITKV